MQTSVALYPKQIGWSSHHTICFSFLSKLTAVPPFLSTIDITGFFRGSISFTYDSFVLQLFSTDFYVFFIQLSL